MAALALVAAGASACGSTPPATRTPAARSSVISTPASSTTTVEEDDVGGAGASTIEGTVVASSAARSTGAAACRSGPPLANVYHPNRLTVVKPCMTVGGTVRSVHFEQDGDVHFDLALDAPYSNLLRPANVSGQHGWLVAEIVPADEPGCTPGRPPRPPAGSYDYGICTGADEASPSIGQHVWVTGPYVLDGAHGGWAEIHPVWALSLHGPGASTSTTAAAGPVPAAQAPAPTTTLGSSGVHIISVTSPVKRGSEASLAAQTSAGAACDLEVTLPSGYRSQSQGLGPDTADSTGRVQWTWRTGTRTSPGTATATVTCGSSSASTSFQITS